MLHYFYLIRLPARIWNQIVTKLIGRNKNQAIQTKTGGSIYNRDNKLSFHFVCNLLLFLLFLSTKMYCKLNEV